MGNKQIVQVVVVLAIVAVLVTIIYIGGTSIMEMARVHMGG